MKKIGFYSEDELMDLLQEGAIDLADFLLYSPQWHDYYCDFCYQRCIRMDQHSASMFMEQMELEDLVALDYLVDDYDFDYMDVENAFDDLDFLY